MWLQIAMIAASALGSILERKQQSNILQQGLNLQTAAMETNLSQARLEAEQGSYNAMLGLRQNLGSQIAMTAARGTSTSAGSASLFAAKSIGNFNNDERTRRMNLLSKEANLRANNVLAGLHVLQSETQLGQQLGSKLFDAVSFNALTNGFK